MSWQIALTALIAVCDVATMAYFVARMFARRSESGPTSLARPGTPAESGRYAARVPASARVWDGYSFRVTARFAGRVRVVIDSERGVGVVCGPRVPRALYVVWIWAQALVLALVPASLVWAVVALDWRGLIAGLALFALSLGISGIGAGLWPGLGEVYGPVDGMLPALEFPLSAVSDVTLGRGWANGGIDIVLLPYVRAIDRMAIDHAVSWDAPDADGRMVRFAVSIDDTAEARELVAALGGVG